MICEQVLLAVKAAGLALRNICTKSSQTDKWFLGPDIVAESLLTEPEACVRTFVIGDNPFLSAQNSSDIAVLILSISFDKKG